MPLCCQQQYKLMELQKKNFSITTQRQFPVVVLTAVSSASAFSCASFCQRPSSPSPPFDELNRWTTVWINELVKNAFNVFLMTCQVGTHPPTKSVAPAAAKAAAKSKGHPIFLQFKFVLFRPCDRYTQTNSRTIGCPRKKSEIFVFKPLVLIFIYFYKENDFFLRVYSSISHIRASIFAAVLCWGHCK